MNHPAALDTRFRERFGSFPKLYRAPGRVNLIGEHTDYNQGFVMPAAINFSCWVAASPREDQKLVIYSENFKQLFEADLSSRLLAKSHWSDYPIGVAAMLEQAGYRSPGANILIQGEVPLGAGLSSSAAVEVSVASALLDLMGRRMDRTQLALLCQRAENEFVGARCGIMDQFIACHGRSRHALMLDCRSLDFRLLRLPEDVHLVICNTMVKHEIARGEYNVRRSQCEEAVRRLAQVMPHLWSLRDVSLEDLEQHRNLLTPVLYHRVQHVIRENQRVLEAASALEAADIVRFGELMRQSHGSLRADFEVSCKELDLMVEIASRQEGLFGARMTGGGFGGCTINLVNASDSAEFQRRVSQEYQAATGLRPDIYVSDAAEGAEAVLSRSAKDD